MYKKVISIVKVTLCSMTLIGLLTACGSTTNVENVESTVNNEVVESTTVAESGEDIGEDNEGALIKDDSIAVYSYKQGEISGHEVKEEVEDDLANFEIIDPNYNGGALAEELEDFEATYITYELLTPTTMYAITYSEVYPDLNASEGVLRVDGCVEIGDKVIVDGKGVYNDVEYYRIARSEGSINPYQSIVPATALSTEKPAEQQPEQQVEQQPVVQQPQQPESTTPNNAEEIVGKDVYDGLTTEEQAGLDAFLNGGNSSANIWTDPNTESGTQSTINENGGFTFSGGEQAIPDDVIGTLKPQ